MPSFSKTSLSRLETCHPDLIDLMKVAIEDGPDFSIICGHRNKEDQEKACREGKSKVHFPNSKHNHSPSLAVDIAPYNGGIDWNDIKGFYFLQGYIKGIASRMGISVRFGLDWNRNYDFDDQKFIDLPHVELIAK